MAWKGVVPSTLRGEGMTPDQFREWVGAVQFVPWRPSGGTLHNTGAPSLAQYQARRATHGRADRFINLQRYFRDDNGWQSAPHFFCDELTDGIYPFTPINQSGTHSPSWNGTKFAVEMFGDFAREDDDRGDGFKVKMNAVAIFAILYARLGLDPDGIVLHKEDKRTNHDCPGKDVTKDDFIERVKEYMGSAGDHSDVGPPLEYVPPAPKPLSEARESAVSPVVGNEGLNLRSGSTAAASVITVLRAGQKVAVFKTAMNGKTPWSYIWLRGPDGKEHTGWVASRYLV